MATFTNQASRLLTLSTPLGEDVLLLTSFAGQEALSRLFTYQLEMISEEEVIAAQDIVGKNVTWGVQEVDKETRWFNGYVSRFSAGGTRLHDRRVYRMEVVPYLWFLTRTADCRIFQNQTTPQIIEAVFGDYGLTDFEPMLKRSYPEWEYCVQYRETAFNFVSRLMEHEGIFYFFKHENGKHTLVLADHKGAYKDVPESPVDYLAGTLAPNHIESWEHRYEFRSGKWAHTDYNFETPSTNLLTNTATIVKLPGVDKFEMFDYPGEYQIKANGEADIKVRMEEEEAAFDVVTGSSGCPTFTPGFKFALGSHEIEAETGKSYLITSIHHSAVDTSQDQEGEAAEYHNTFTCIPAEVTYRPPRLTPKPIVQGPQTAEVVGPGGEEIFADKYSRIKVQFHWDRYGQKDENSSCWMRVSTTWAGKGWGFVQIPRIGQEVVVGFEEGDPDRPLVIGSVYNAEHMPPNALPGDKMVSGIKSNSTPGGGGYNGLMLNDTKKKEMVTMHAQKDMSTTVGHDDTQHVKNNRKINVDGTHTETIKKDTKISIAEGPYSFAVVANTASYFVKGAVDISYMNKLDMGVVGPVSETFNDSQTTTVKNAIMVKSTAAGIEINGKTEIKLISGASSITLKADGTIDISGENITVSGKATAKIGTGNQNLSTSTSATAVGGAEISVGTDSTGKTSIVAGVVKIN